MLMRDLLKTDRRSKSSRVAASKTGPVGWLGREDSNLRMAESKSDYFPSNINAHFETTAEIGPNPINRGRALVRAGVIWSRS